MPDTPSNQNPYNEQQEHYKSLIELFKYCVTFLFSLLAIIGALIGYLTYSNGQEMREALDKEKSEVKQEMKEQRSELNDKERAMETNVLNLITTSREDVRMTREEAVNQIGSIKNVATTEAKNRIDEVFSEKNIDQFVEGVAKERMEPQIQKMVDDKMAIFQKIEKSKLDTAIANLQSINSNKRLSGLAYLQYNPYIELSDEQVSIIIKLAEKDSLDQNFSANLLLTLLTRKSDVARDFFKNTYINNANSIRLIFSQVAFYIFGDDKQDLNFYKKIIAKDENKPEAFRGIINLSRVNKSTTILLLNSKDLVDFAFDSSNLEILEKERHLIGGESLIQFKPEEFKNTYFFTKQ